MSFVERAFVVQELQWVTKQWYLQRPLPAIQSKASPRTDGIASSSPDRRLVEPDGVSPLPLQRALQLFATCTRVKGHACSEVHTALPKVLACFSNVTRLGVLPSCLAWGNRGTWQLTDSPKALRRGEQPRQAASACFPLSTQSLTIPSPVTTEVQFVGPNIPTQAIPKNVQ